MKIGIVYNNQNYCDGLFSAAIVNYYEQNRDKELLPVDDTIPILELLEDKDYDKLYILGISYDLSTMMEIKNRFNNLIWVDQNQIMIKKVDGFEVDGKREKGKSTALLCWEYLYPNIEAPYSIQLINKFILMDINYSEELWVDYVCPFRLGLGLYNPDPTDISFWDNIVNNDILFLINTISDGKIVYNYLKEKLKVELKNGFQTKIKNKKAIAINTQFSDPFVFYDIFDFEKYDVVIMYSYNINKYNVYLYSPKVDVSKIANNFTGSGNNTFYNFSCNRLPFPLPKNRKVSYN